MQLPYYSLKDCGYISPLDALDEAHRDEDARGLMKLWEPPKPTARYVIGIDPTGGITGWDRSLRTEDDLTTDNGAIEVIRITGHGQPDVQVAEYAAPIDAEDLADPAAFLGRLYAGNSDYGEALTIIEIWPGPGLLTQRRMMQKYQYQNLWRWEKLDSATAVATKSYGWSSNAKTLQLLWSRFSRHLSHGGLTIRSPWLNSELANLQNFPGVTFPAPSGEMEHDDRVRAAAMAIWAGHDWSFGEGQAEPSQVEMGLKRPDWQASDISYEDMLDQWEDAFIDMSEG